MKQRRSTMTTLTPCTETNRQVATRLLLYVGQSYHYTLVQRGHRRIFVTLYQSLKNSSPEREGHSNESSGRKSSISRLYVLVKWCANPTPARGALLFLGENMLSRGSHEADSNPFGYESHRSRYFTGAFLLLSSWWMSPFGSS